jgi:membrane fusion protein (multidrug efflux system)
MPGNWAGGPGDGGAISTDSPVPAPKKRPVLVAAAVAVVVVAAIGWFAFRNLASQPQAATPAPPPSVGVQVVSQKGVNRSFEFVGRIKAVNEVELRARVEGFLEKVLFTEGQHVKVGQLLYQIEKVQYQAEVDRTKANIAIDEAELINAQVQYSRSLDLSKQNYGTQALVDTNKASTTPISARRSTGASAASGTRSVTSSIRRVASWRSSSARIRSTSNFR